MNKRIKAVGDWKLDVLAVPYGSQDNKDADGEYFSPDTNFYLDNYKPPAFFYHGFSENGVPMGDPALIGKTESVEVKEDGVWLRIILDKASELAKRVWDSAKEGLARASSGSINHLVRKEDDGKITHWPLAEISLFDMTGSMQPANQYAVAVPVMKANYKKAGIEVPEYAQEQPKGESKEVVSVDDTETKAKIKKEKIMSDEPKVDIVELAKKAAKEVLDAEKAKREAEEAVKAEIAVKAKEMADAQIETLKAEAAKSGRLPFEEVPTVAKFNEVWKYDELDTGALALGIDILNSGAAKGKKGASRASENMYRALALRLAGSKEPEQQHAFKMLQSKVGKELKADDIMYTTLSSYGDEWVGIEYSRDLWKKIRLATPVIAKMPQMTIPDGYEASVIPLESTDPTWYKVAEATDHTSGRPDVTVTASKVGTDNKTVSIVKMGSRVTWSGELREDSVVPILNQIRQQMITSGSEQLENAVVNGDTETATLTNINDIAGTPAGTEVFMLVDGFRKLPLITNTGNSRDAGSMDVDDFLKTIQLLGAAGKNGIAGGLDKVAFVIGPQEYYSLMREEHVKTQDVFRAATLENGNIVKLWGRDLIVSGQMCAGSADLLSNTAGKVDIDTTTNNTKGSILAVRWDQWKFAWKRRMTLETDRYPESDTNVLIAMVRFGLAYRDTEASAISYNVTV